jgi:hypothetical protein
MSTDTDLSTDTDEGGGEPVETIGEPVTAPEEVVEVRRRAGLAVALGTGASLTAVAYLARAVNGGGVLDWVLAVVLGVIGVVELAALVDARTPLLVADELGVRLRLGRTWVGLPWAGLQVLEYRPRRGWRDGLLVARPTCVGRVLEDLDPPARRIARANRRLRGAPLATPLGLATRVVGAGPDLPETLRALADGRATVVVPEPEAVVVPEPETEAVPETDAETEPRTRRLPDPRPAVALWISGLAARFDRTRDDEEEDDEGFYDQAQDDDGLRDSRDEHPSDDVAPIPLVPPLVASRTPEPTRAPVSAARAELHHEVRAELDDETQVWEQAAKEPAPVSEVEPPLLIDDYVAEPPPDPVIGPELAAARTRLGLTVDQLAERTRIRPHVIESLEVDDFGACGGDFYARGHLRTLARVLGLDVTPLLAAYDERYADAPIDPRRVFEAELAGAGSMRATRGGPNWSILVAAVMALVLCWSVARLATGGAAHVEDRAVLSGSGGPNHVTTTNAAPVPVTLTATAGGARVVVRDGNNRLVFSGDLAYGQSHTLRAAPPIRIQSTDGAVRVAVAGHDRGHMGPAGRPATQSYVAR